MFIQTREPSTARANRAEVTKYVFAGLVTVAVAFFGFLGNRVANTIDRTDAAVQELREAVAVVRSYTSGVQATLSDHEARLRADRDTLVAHGVRLTEDELKLIAVDQRTATPTSTQRR
jgi:16S rRNA C1402 (ribose-2'-O) methylase RsmI